MLTASIVRYEEKCSDCRRVAFEGVTHQCPHIHFILARPRKHDRWPLAMLLAPRGTTEFSIELRTMQLGNALPPSTARIKRIYACGGCMTMVMRRVLCNSQLRPRPDKILADETAIETQR